MKITKNKIIFEKTGEKVIVVCYELKGGWSFGYTIADTKKPCKRYWENSTPRLIRLQGKLQSRGYRLTHEI